MFLFWRDLFFGLIAWSGSVFAEKKLTTALFIQPHNYSDWVLIVMFQPISVILSMGAIFFSVLLLYRIMRRNGNFLLVRRVFPAFERMLHAVLFLYGAFLLLIQLGKFPWITGVALGVLILYDVIQLLPVSSRDVY